MGSVLSTFYELLLLIFKIILTIDVERMPLLQDVDAEASSFITGLRVHT